MKTYFCLLLFHCRAILQNRQVPNANHLQAWLLNGCLITQLLKPLHYLTGRKNDLLRYFITL